jgi:predicted membrane chloride channel (bestrophin family)
MQMAWDRVRQLNLILNARTLRIAILAVLATWVSLQLGLVADFPMTIISTAVIFPIVFTIGNAYKRREKVLDDYGNIKAHGRALFFAARDWLDDSSDPRMRQIENAMLDLLHSCRTLFTNPPQEMERHERAVYASFSKISEFVKDLRADGLNSGECARANQFVTKMITSFERIKHTYQYRTPRSLRAFSDFFMILLPVVYGPYFAYLAKEYDISSITYVMPILFAVILSGLDNIQTHLEDPFDQIGEDDVTFNAEKFVTLLSCGAQDLAPSNAAQNRDRILNLTPPLVPVPLRANN